MFKEKMTKTQLELYGDLVKAEWGDIELNSSDMNRIITSVLQSINNDYLHTEKCKSQTCCVCDSLSGLELTLKKLRKLEKIIKELERLPF